MEEKILSLMVVTLLIVSCQNRNSTRENGEKSSTTEIKSEDSLLRKNEIVTSTITTKDGIMLKQTFDNSVGTCTLDLNGELIQLKQERMASGIKYSNEHYVYTNWHGETRLYKEGKLIFSYDE